MTALPAPKGNKFALGNKGGGRPSKYNPIFAKQAKKACEAGFTDSELAQLFGVSEVTINSWKLEHEEFYLALRMAKSPADDRMERSLYQRGIGYDYEVRKIVEDNEGGKQITVTTQHIPGDVGAQFRWLSNRRPDKWRDKHEVEGTLRTEHVFTFNIFENDLRRMDVIEHDKVVDEEVNGNVKS